MRIAISAPIKKDFQKEAEALFPDCQLLWMEDLPEEERDSAIRTADVVLTHNIVGDLTKEEQQLLGIRVWYRRRGRASTICLWQNFPQT